MIRKIGIIDNSRRNFIKNLMGFNLIDMFRERIRNKEFNLDTVEPQAKGKSLIQSN